jgi:phosphoribosylanthranilate isomerase
MKLLIKICGVTRPEDAALAAAEGADLVGLNFWRGSPRFVKDDQAREVLAALPSGVLKVGVFVNAHPLVVTETVSELKLDRVQLHGDEKVGSWSDLRGERLIRAIRVVEENALREALLWEAGLFIFDVAAKSGAGGGAPALWRSIRGAACRPFLLAGGLNSENVAEAVAARLVAAQGV